MLQSDQRILSPVPPPPGGEISAAALLSELDGHTAKTLIFNYQGRDVLPGYHVTEVKIAAFQALDCGANYETCYETFIQLWDIPQEDERRFMPVGKFLAIIGKVSDAVPFDPNAKLTFEVSDGKSAMQLYRASSIDVEADAVRVGLTQRPASSSRVIAGLNNRTQRQVHAAVRSPTPNRAAVSAKSPINAPPRKNLA